MNRNVEVGNRYCCTSTTMLRGGRAAAVQQFRSECTFVPHNMQESGRERMGKRGLGIK